MKTGLEKFIEWWDLEVEKVKYISSIDSVYVMGKARAFFAEEQSNRSCGITMREPDLLDWRNHKEEFKAWLKNKEQAQKTVGDMGLLEVGQILRCIEENFDHDEYAHKYGTMCRCCAAKEARGILSRHEQRKETVLAQGTVAYDESDGAQIGCDYMDDIDAALLEMQGKRGKLVFVEDK